MLRTERLATTTAPDGTELILYRHGRDYYLRVGTVELMSTRRPHSEQMLAELCCTPIATREAPRVLIGGLGFGFTLRAALAILPPDATIVVAELLDDVIRWNREYDIAADAMADPRVELRHQDVAITLKDGPFDAILLDVDNGAEVFTTDGNAGLYQARGIRDAVAALRPGGRLGYWSADDDPAFAEALRRAGLQVEETRARAHRTSGPSHSLIIARHP